MHTLKDAAARLGMPVRILRRAVELGRVKTHRFMVGGQHWISDQELDRFKRDWVDPVRPTNG